MIEIVEKHNRTELEEGRNNGMAFAFLERINATTYYTVQPLSPCKDYTDEVVTTERYGIPTQGCGLVYPKKLGLFESDWAYLGIEILATMPHDCDNCGGSYSWDGEDTCDHYSYSSSMKKDIQNLKDNYKNLKKFLNNIEKLIDLKLTQITPAKDNRFLIKFDTQWCISTHSISLYTLLVRVGVHYNGTQDVMQYLKNIPHYEDRTLIQSALPKLELIIEKKKLPPNTMSWSREQLRRGYQPHGYGILSWRYKDTNAFVEQELVD